MVHQQPTLPMRRLKQRHLRRPQILRLLMLLLLQLLLSLNYQMLQLRRPLQLQRQLLHYQ
jgi:hypothetical protein